MAQREEQESGKLKESEAGHGGVSLGGSGHRHDGAWSGKSHHLEGPVLNGEAMAWDGGLSGWAKAHRVLKELGCGGE